jgi:hypothetical protein
MEAYKKHVNLWLQKVASIENVPYHSSSRQTCLK